MQCGFDGKKSINIPTLKSLYLINCNIKNFEKFSPIENLHIRGCNNFSLEGIQQVKKTKRLYLQNCNIKGFENIEKFINLEYLDIDGSSIDSKETLENLQRKIQVSNEKESLQIE